MRRPQHLYKQRGLILLGILLMLILASGYFVFSRWNSGALFAQKNHNTLLALTQAKQALIGWSVNHPEWPGLMPYPDRNQDDKYDGFADCYAKNVNFGYNFVIGQLPVLGNGVGYDINCQDSNKITAVNSINLDIRDGNGDRLWYEVSQNLLYDYYGTGNFPIINPNIVNNPNAKWLEVRNRNGVLISNRVAVVIMSPGVPIGMQDRSGSAPLANQFLDKITADDGNVYQNYGYPQPGVTAVQTFIQDVSSNDFNDKLIYITIDELIEALQKRAAGEARKALLNYYNNQHFFPYAAGINSNTNAYQCVQGNLYGLLPVISSTPYPCSCTANQSCNCHFSGVNSIQYTRNSNVYGMANGACSLTNSNKTCACKGAGACFSSTGKTAQFTCDACGNCSSSSAVAGGYTFSAKAAFTNPTNGCISKGNDITCTGTAAGTFNVQNCTAVEFSSVVSLPNWFKLNKWHDYLYYAVSPNCTSANHANCTNAPQLTVGSVGNASSVVITTGAPIISAPFASSKNTAQNRPSCAVNDYLDSVQNTQASENPNIPYDAVNIPRTSYYNDQMFIVSPL